jgi:hypothetical protein
MLGAVGASDPVRVSGAAVGTSEPAPGPLVTQLQRD